MALIAIMLGTNMLAPFAQAGLGVTTTLAAVGSSSGGNETQAFCYDSQERLVWAATSGTGPCGQVGSEGITGAGYTASCSYDTLGRITSASVLDGNGQPLGGAAQGSYTYDATHVHSVASVGSGTTGYAASYDAAGNMACRAVGAATCGSGNEQLTYDSLGKLIAWQNASGSSELYAYDGSGQRVWQQASATSGGTTTSTTTTYVLGVQEVTTTSITGSQPTTNTISYYGLPGGLSASRDASGLVVQMSDVLGTPIAAENLQTGLVGEQLRTPYGQARYSASASSGGGMHTSSGFTGQREDNQAPGSSGLDYFNARYYDPVVGQFTQADPTRPDLGSSSGTDEYGYIDGQVENATDPSGLSDADWFNVLQTLFQTFIAAATGGRLRGVCPRIQRLRARKLPTRQTWGRTPLARRTARPFGRFGCDGGRV